MGSWRSHARDTAAHRHRLPVAHRAATAAALQKAGFVAAGFVEIDRLHSYTLSGRPKPSLEALP